MANPAPAPTPGAADRSVQSSISVGGRWAKADVAMLSLVIGSEASEDPVSEPSPCGYIQYGLGIGLYAAFLCRTKPALERSAKTSHKIKRCYRQTINLD